MDFFHWKKYYHGLFFCPVTGLKLKCLNDGCVSYERVAFCFTVLTEGFEYCVYYLWIIVMLKVRLNFQHIFIFG